MQEGGGYTVIYHPLYMRTLDCKYRHTSQSFYERRLKECCSLFVLIGYDFPIRKIQGVDCMKIALVSCTKLKLIIFL